MSDASNTPAAPAIPSTPAPAANQAATNTTDVAQNNQTKAPLPPAPKQEPVSAKKKYKIKVDRNEEELEFDPTNDEEVKTYLQKARAADKRFQEAAEVRKAAMNFIEDLRKNPKKVLSDPNIGVDIKKFAEEIINEQIAEMEKPPEQREKEELQRKLQEYEQRAKQLEQHAKNQEFQRLQAEQERKLETDITAALDVGGIPKTPRTVARMAEMMMVALSNGIDLSAQDIAPLVKNNTMSEFKEVISALSDDQLDDFLGKEIISRLRKKNMAKAKAAVTTANSVKSTGNSPKTKVSEKDNKKMTIREFLKV